jgi:hypothetical protein
MFDVRFVTFDYRKTFLSPMITFVRGLMLIFIDEHSSLNGFDSEKGKIFL